jgi:hypothetical protein
MSHRTTMKFLLLNFASFLILNTALSQKTREHFKSELDFGSGTIISTFLDVRTADNQFTITSPKNADIRMMGAKARLGRLLGKAPKKGIIISIKGVQNKDSLFGDTNIPMFGKLAFKGVLHNGKLSGQLLNKDGSTIGKIKGVTSTEDRMDFTALHPQVMKTIKDNIYSTDVLKTKEWKKFEKKTKRLFHNAHDDIEVFFGFHIHSPKLPFSHLYFMIGEDSEDTEEEVAEESPVNTNPSVILEARNDSTAYLQIKNFSTSTNELADIMPQIVQNTAFKHLIIDLRDNGGGGIQAAFEFAKHIVTEDMELGYFPTNKLSYTGYQPEVFRALPALQPKTTEEFGNELKSTPGVKLVFNKPNNPVFTGKLYILTNSNTGSTCEPIVYVLKSRNKATIIGEKTAGAMLSASPFVVTGKYLVILPVGDFYTHDGVRLDRVGVEPNVNVKSAEAEQKALEIINGGGINTKR